MQHKLTRFLLAGSPAALALALVQLAFCAPAHADERVLAPSPALACLTRTADAPALPDYPPERYARKEGGELIVELEFRAADRGPKVRQVGKSIIYAEFVDAVETFADYYRVPCLGAGDPPVLLRQRYVFVPNDGRKVVPSAPTDRADPARRERLACIVHGDGRERPEYPNAARRYGLEERMVLRFRYSAPDRPPELTWLAPPEHQSLRRAVEDYARELRMPCLGNEAIAYEQMFVFTLQGGERTVLRDTTLVQLLGATKDYPLPAYFDFNTMACPFDVRLTYMRPYLPNTVRQLESGNAARAPLLEWMSRMTLNASDAVIRKVLGDSMTVTIPCGTLDL